MNMGIERFEHARAIMWMEDGLVLLHIEKRQVEADLVHNSLGLNPDQLVYVREYSMVERVLQHRLGEPMRALGDLKSTVVFESVQAWVWKMKELYGRPLHLPGTRWQVSREDFDSGEADFQALLDRCDGMIAYVLSVELQDSGVPDYVNAIVPVARLPEGHPATDAGILAGPVMLHAISTRHLVKPRSAAEYGRDTPMTATVGGPDVVDGGLSAGYVDPATTRRSPS